MVDVAVNLLAMCLLADALYRIYRWVTRSRRIERPERHVISVMVGDLVLMRAEIRGEVVSLDQASDGAVSNSQVAGQTWWAPDGQLMMTLACNVLHLTGQGS